MTTAMQTAISTAQSGGQTTVRHYTFDSVDVDLLVPFGVQTGLSLGLHGKGNVAEQQYDAAVAGADAANAGVESARAQVSEAQASIKAAESRLAQAKVGQQQAGAELRTAETAPQQVAASRARAEADVLDEEGADDSGGHGGGNRGGAEEEREADARQCDVPHAVAEQGQAALHEEDADQRGEDADEGCSDERPLHEVELEDGRHGSSPTGLGESSPPS